jgi:hypothetical protein
MPVVSLDSVSFWLSVGSKHTEASIWHCRTGKVNSFIKELNTKFEIYVCLPRPFYYMDALQKKSG